MAAIWGRRRTLMAPPCQLSITVRWKHTHFQWWACGCMFVSHGSDQIAVVGLSLRLRVVTIHTQRWNSLSKSSDSWFQLPTRVVGSWEGKSLKWLSSTRATRKLHWHDVSQLSLAMLMLARAKNKQPIEWADDLNHSGVLSKVELSYLYLSFFFTFHDIFYFYSATSQRDILNVFFMYIDSFKEDLSNWVVVEHGAYFLLAD